MKFARIRTASGVRPAGLGSDGAWHDLSGVVADLSPDTLAAFLSLDQRGIDAAPLLEAAGGFDAPLGRPGKIVCIGLNYTDHARETGAQAPAEPICFLKAASATAGPNDPLTLPVGSEKTDWEVELGVVIGKRAKNVPEDRAMDHVAGYMIVNDISERAFQIERGGQWTKGKSHDGFAPMGPWLVTADEVADPQALRLWTEVNGERMQDGTTADMIFGVRHLVAYMSRFMTLEPGDVIATGTPAGVGMGRGRFLRPGDVMELGIDGLGRQRIEVMG